ncbi:dienelactone hydrolase family protein [Amycolatopsis thermophila]|uniref:Pimeloyl-ACP methyl ester carboxylesterase n=1 Tax=Amycolatopsis thermophila TaxID=206084 RepID=A0ABU0ERL4_9PSEU|nr:alpha/beta fold hydrolase [Amycolatopsis thermophila]MDQ0377799.1 pimeloyl-ACP methyl ester carboxylesterase [Amycolatopsis thermophila]
MTVPLTVDPGLEGDLTVPADAIGMIVFAHGSGSSRHSARNIAVARELQDNRFGTLLFDLLSPDEDGGGRRFDIDLLAERLRAAIAELGNHGRAGELPLGLFGASTGAAAALRTAAAEGERVKAVVSRGGRPDLAGDALSRVTSPTLLIVGARDEEVVRLNETAARELAGPHRLEVVPHATHLFEEPGALETVAQLAAAWFSDHVP